MTYAEKLRSPKWQKRRLEIMERDRFSCQICSDTETTLNVHHLIYRQNADPWEYGDDELITLCEPCHRRVTSLLKKLRLNLYWDVNVGAYEALTELLDGGYWESATILNVLLTWPGARERIYDAAVACAEQKVQTA